MTRCPVCCDESSIQKVSSVVAAGSGTFTGYGVGVGRHDVISGFTAGATTTHLAAALAYPVPRKRGGCLLVIGMACVVIASMLAAILITDDVPTEFAGIVMIPSAGAALFLSLAIRGIRRYSRELPMWHRAQWRWAQLYYCFRDDLVFNPITGAYRPVQSMADLLWA